MKAIVTGSGGLIGSAMTEMLCELGWTVLGLDNDQRSVFFGPGGSTAGNVRSLQQRFPLYKHFNADIRDRQGVRDLLSAERPEFIVHAAGQPSHDKAASIPYDDFDVNAAGTFNLLVAARDYCPEAPFCFTSTNKVYGDRPNTLPLVERERRFEYADGRIGVDESMSIDQCLHSLFGASKLAADVLCQEFARYFQMPIGIFRAGCMTGPQHAAVELHGYLSYIAACAVSNRGYTIYGYKGKQVRDQIHSRDVAHLFLQFFRSPKCGEVYNLGGGAKNSISILETIDALGQLGYPLRYDYVDHPRKGDHICYISDLTKLSLDFPNFRQEYDIASILEDIVRNCRSRPGAAAVESLQEKS